MVRGSTSSSLIGSLARGVSCFGHDGYLAQADCKRAFSLARYPKLRAKLGPTSCRSPSHPLHHPEPPRRQRQAVPADGGVLTLCGSPAHLTPPISPPPAHAAHLPVNPPSIGSHSALSRVPCHSTTHGNPAQRQCCSYPATHQRNLPALRQALGC